MSQGLARTGCDFDGAFFGRVSSICDNFDFDGCASDHGNSGVYSGSHHVLNCFRALIAQLFKQKPGFVKQGSSTSKSQATPLRIKNKITPIIIAFPWIHGSESATSFDEIFRIELRPFVQYRNPATGGSVAFRRKADFAHR